MRAQPTTLVAAAVLLAACGQGQLTRPNAVALLQAHPAILSLRSQASLSSLQDGIDLDVWDSQWTASTRSSQFFQAIAPGQGVFKTQLPIEIEVTGIVPSDDNAEVQFRWRYHNVNPELRSLIVSSGTGTAPARRYDDGWRIESVLIERDAPIPLTAEERTQLSNTFAEIAVRRKDLLASAEQAYVGCTTVEGGELVSGALYFWPREHVPARTLSSLRLGGAGITAVVIRQTLGLYGVSEGGTILIPFAQLTDISRPREYIYERGAQAWVEFGTSGWRSVAFASMEAAQAFHDEMQRALASWKTRCGPAIANWKALLRERQFWR